MTIHEYVEGLRQFWPVVAALAAVGLGVGLMIAALSRSGTRVPSPPLPKPEIEPARPALQGKEVEIVSRPAGQEGRDRRRQRREARIRRVKQAIAEREASGRETAGLKAELDRLT